MSTIIAVRSQRGRGNRQRQPQNQRAGGPQGRSSGLIVAPVRPPGQGQSRNARRRRNAAGISQSSAPAAFGTTFSGGVPTYMGGSKPGVLRLAHTEELTTLVGTTQFTSAAHGGVPGAFVWLDGVARAFSRFRWVRFRVWYSTVSATSDRGDVSLGIFYDALDSLPQSMTEASAVASSKTVPVWSRSGPDTVLELDCSRLSKPLWPYLSPSEALSMSPEDLVSYVPFWLLVSKQTSLNGQAVGRVYVQYEVELSDPIPSRMNTTPSTGQRRGLKIHHGEHDPEPDVEPMAALAESIRRLLPVASSRPETPPAHEQNAPSTKGHT